MARLNKNINFVLSLVEKVMHISILIIVIYLCGKEIYDIVAANTIGVSSIMLIFIYLEIIQMIQIYFQSGKIPVRYPLYICMFNLARIISFESLDSVDALNHSIAILMVGLALLALAGRKYIRDVDITLSKISNIARENK